MRTALSRLAAAAVVLLAGCQADRSRPTRVDDPHVKNLYQSGDVYISGAADEAGLEELGRRGVKVVVDVRLPEQVSAGYPERVRALGMRYHHVPMKSDQLTPEQAEQLAAIMRESGEQSMWLHCSSGNRAAAAYGVYNATCRKLTVEEALEQARAAGMRNEKISQDLREYLERSQAEQE